MADIILKDSSGTSNLYLGVENIVVPKNGGGTVTFGATLVDDVTVNGTSVVGVDKIARVVVPTKTSDITNDSGFITSAYHDSTKVDVIQGKGLSTNDYDNTEKGNVASAVSHLADTTIHVTTSDKSIWNGKYDKPSGGIPKSDLTSAVQTSLDLADSAIQSHQDISGKADKRTIKTVMDATAVVNTDYYLGTQTSVSVVLPVSASIGDTINVVFYSDVTATTLSIIGTTIGDMIIPESYTRVDLLFQHEGQYWAIITNSMNILPIPPEYEKVRYLESTGSQYIETNIVPDFNYSAEVVGEFKSGTVVFGTSNHPSDAQANGYTLFLATGNGYSAWGTANTVSTKSSIGVIGQFGLKYSIKINKGGEYVDGVKKVSFNSNSNFESSNKLRLFGIQPGTSYSMGSHRFYQWKCWDDNNQIVANFIPCRRKSDYKPGMYDLVTNTFFVNQGSGDDFLIGV